MSKRGDSLNGEAPSTPRLRAINELTQGSLSPRRFSLDGCDSPHWRKIGGLKEKESGKMGGRREEFFVCWAVICTYRKEEKKDYDKNTSNKQRTRKKDEKNVLEVFIFACLLFSCVTFCSLWGFYIYIVFDIHVINKKNAYTHLCIIFVNFCQSASNFLLPSYFFGGKGNIK